MTKPLFLASLLIITLSIACNQPTFTHTPLTDIEIIRDDFGVPHIYAPTDAGTAYGLAWAQCEDDFITMQEQMLAIKGLYGEVKGQDGAVADFGIKFMGLREIAEEQYETRLSDETRRLLEGYVNGANAYAKHHPDRLLHDEIFPITGIDLAVGTLLGLTNLTHGAHDLSGILGGAVVASLESDVPTGSNAIAVSKRLNPDGETLLAINSHQPMEGWYSWYEAHLVSGEGLNILGGTFAGGATIFHGVNEHLGWAHTVNHPDMSDVYRLEMHPTEPLKYKFDGKWKSLEVREYKSWVKLWWILKVPVTRTSYMSVHGPTFETEEGYFAWRNIASQDISGIEQWYKMNKATDYSSFMHALDMQGLPSMNIVYADKEDNIYYLSNGRLPRRDVSFNWNGIMDGDTSATLWSMNENYTIDYLPQVLNPDCGYVFNTNNTPFNSTGEACNPKEPMINGTMGFQRPGQDNNRSRRLSGLLAASDSIDYKKFKEIKYDRNYPEYLGSRNLANLEEIMDVDITKQPHLKDAVELIQKWDRGTDLDNQSAALFILIATNITSKLREEHRLRRAVRINEEDIVYGFEQAIDYLMEHYGKLDVTIREFQVHSRGDVEIPIAGGPDALAAMYGAPTDDGKWRVMAGETYIMMVRFTEDGPIMETINAYGSSAVPGHPHSTDQMQMFADQKLKPMTLDFEEVRKKYGESMYHPSK